MMNPFTTLPWYWIAGLALAGIALLLLARVALRRRRRAADRHAGMDAGGAIESGSTRQELRKLGYALAVALPAIGFGLYLTLSMPAPPFATAATHPPAAAEAAGHDILKMIQKVEERTREDPKDGAAWALLGRTYASVKHWPEALHAYEKAYALRPDVPMVMTGYAEALAIKNGRVLEGKALQLVQAALEKDPNDLKGLELAGLAAFQDQGYAKAAFYFKRLLKLLPPESPYAQDVHEAYREANRLANAGRTGLDNLSDPGPAKADSNARIRGVVDIQPDLKAKFGEQDTLFLFARGKDSGTPVAALRTNGQKLPLEFELNDSMARNAEQRLSKFKEVNLTVRVSRSGEISAKPGDLEGTLSNVKIGSQDVRLVIDRVVR